MTKTFTPNLNLLASYQNGNVLTQIYEDGTKVREFDNIPEFKFPESLDIKITDYCDMGCPQCHEKSTKAGKHGDLDFAFHLLSDLPAGIELAIGGGNPLDHPDIKNFLLSVKRRGWYANVTMNQRHLKQELPYFKQLKSLIDEKLVYGVGISYMHAVIDSDLLEIWNDNFVVHVIAGYHNESDVLNLIHFLKKKNIHPKILILGYKVYGRGHTFYEKNNDAIGSSLNRWNAAFEKDFLSLLDVTLSFDNLALAQLNMKNRFSAQDWETFFMGEDGTSTFYLDFVKCTYAVSSSSATKYSINGRNMFQVFEDVKLLAERERKLKQPLFNERLAIPN